MSAQACHTAYRPELHMCRTNRSGLTPNFRLRAPAAQTSWRVSRVEVVRSAVGAVGLRRPTGAVGLDYLRSVRSIIRIPEQGLPVTTSMSGLVYTIPE